MTSPQDLLRPFFYVFVCFFRPLQSFTPCYQTVFLYEANRSSIRLFGFLVHASDSCRMASHRGSPGRARRVWEKTTRRGVSDNDHPSLIRLYTQLASFLKPHHDKWHLWFARVQYFTF